MKRYLFILAARSAWNRRYTLGLTLAAIALATLLLLGIERLRVEARASFAQTVSGTDLIVGARASPLQLTLYTVFRLGEATQNMDWQSVQWLRAHPAVAWAVPLSLGDSHRGYPVLGTDASYFTHFRHGDGQALHFREGAASGEVFDAVLGAEVAEQLGYRPGDTLTLTHGSSETGLAHGDKPFRVAGILARTGTPVDRTVHISLAGMEAIHLDWQGGAPIPGATIPAEFVRKFDLTPKAVTGVLVGLKSRADVFAMQREIAAYRPEALTGALPGVVLDQLWALLSIGETALQLIAALVGVAGLAGLVAVILAGLDARRRELAILRAVGARARELLCLLAIEGLVITLLGVLLGALMLLAAQSLLAPWLAAEYGLVLQRLWFSASETGWMAGILAAGFAASLLPGWRAYRLSLADGLTPHT